MELRYEFDGEKFYLGSLCKRGHAWPGTTQSLRRSCKGGGCVDCEKTRLYNGTKFGTEYRRERKRKIRQQLKEQGLSSRGRPLGPAGRPANPDAALQRSLRPGRRSPTVPQLVMQAQWLYWRENPDEKRRHDARWDQASWWLQYQINPDLRLYHREKSKRRKARDRGQTPLQVPVTALRQRFNEFSNCCAYCGQEGDMQIEHVEPISEGGLHDIGNIVPACPSCNYSKRTSEMESWYRRQPFFSELRLHAIRRVTRQPEGAQLALALA